MKSSLVIIHYFGSHESEVPVSLISASSLLIGVEGALERGSTFDV